MKDKLVFKRYELKYLLTKHQADLLLHTSAPFLQPDEYGRSTIRNIYFDTDTFRLARRSAEKPPFKEKLRVRSYKRLKPNDPAFVELKRKYQSVVYKRRLSAPYAQAMDCLCGGVKLPEQTQIAKEIQYFCAHYETLQPTVFLSYERDAFCAKDGGDLRITLDQNILYRRDALSLCEEVGGIPLMEPGMVLLEMKTAGGIPLWMTRFLTQQRLFKTSFSKYGAAYEHMMTHCQLQPYPSWKGDLLYA